MLWKKKTFGAPSEGKSWPSEQIAYELAICTLRNRASTNKIPMDRIEDEARLIAKEMHRKFKGQKVNEYTYITELEKQVKYSESKY